jgi:hypothetical protein
MKNNKIYFTIRENDGRGAVIFSSEDKYETAAKIEALARTTRGLAFCVDTINDAGEVVTLWK